MAAKAQPTLRSLATAVGVIEQQIQEILGSLEDAHTSRATAVGIIEQQIRDIGGSLEEIQVSRAAEAERIWIALGALAGLDGIAAGMANIGELLAPLRLLVPPSAAEELDPGVPEALKTTRAALGFLPRRDTNFLSVTTDWDAPVSYIGQVPRPDPRDPDAYRERVA